MKNSTKKAARSAPIERSLLWIWFGGSIFIVLGFGVLLLSDAAHILRCKRALEKPGTQLVQATLLKEKKNRRGNLLWDLKFHPAGAEAMQGRREAFERVFGTHKPGDTIPITYPPSAPECWDLSISSAEPKAYVANQNFTISVNGAFGLFFTVCGILLSLWSGLRLFYNRRA